MVGEGQEKSCPNCGGTLSPIITRHSLSHKGLARAQKEIRAYRAGERTPIGYSCYYCKDQYDADLKFIRNAQVWPKDGDKLKIFFNFDQKNRYTCPECGGRKFPRDEHERETITIRTCKRCGFAVDIKKPEIVSSGGKIR